MKDGGTAFTIKLHLLNKIEQFKLGTVPSKRQESNNNSNRNKSANAILPSLETIQAIEKSTECPDKAKLVGTLLKLLSKE